MYWFDPIGGVAPFEAADSRSTSGKSTTTRSSTASRPRRPARRCEDRLLPRPARSLHPGDDRPPGRPRRSRGREAIVERCPLPGPLLTPKPACTPTPPTSTSSSAPSTARRSRSPPVSPATATSSSPSSVKSWPTSLWAATAARSGCSTGPVSAEPEAVRRSARGSRRGITSTVSTTTTARRPTPGTRRGWWPQQDLGSCSRSCPLVAPGHRGVGDRAEDRDSDRAADERANMLVPVTTPRRLPVRRTARRSATGEAMKPMPSPITSRRRRSATPSCPPHDRSEAPSRRSRTHRTVRVRKPTRRYTRPTATPRSASRESAPHGEAATTAPSQHALGVHWYIRREADQDHADTQRHRLRAVQHRGPKTHSGRIGSAARATRRTQRRRAARPTPTAPRARRRAPGPGRRHPRAGRGCSTRPPTESSAPRHSRACAGFPLDRPWKRVPAQHGGDRKRECRRRNPSPPCSRRTPRPVGPRVARPPRRRRRSRDLAPLRQRVHAPMMVSPIGGTAPPPLLERRGTTISADHRPGEATQDRDDQED